jgi:hypothetical protein
MWNGSWVYGKYWDVAEERIGAGHISDKKFKRSDTQVIIRRLTEYKNIEQWKDINM